MAYICTKPPHSCSGCEHFRKDTDSDRKVCWAAQDEAKARKKG